MRESDRHGSELLCRSTGQVQRRKEYKGWMTWAPINCPVLSLPDVRQDMRAGDAPRQGARIIRARDGAPDPNMPARRRPHRQPTRLAQAIPYRENRAARPAYCGKATSIPTKTKALH